MSMKLKKKVKELTGDDATQATQIAALQADVGASDTTDGSLKKRCKTIETDVTAINTAIGDPADPAEGTILARLYALEHPPAQQDSGSGGTE